MSFSYRYRKSISLVALTALIVASAVTPAAAEYSPQLGRFLQRDPHGTGLVVATTDGWISGLGSFIERNIAVTSHFSEIQRGIVDLRNILYFFSMTALFLVLNTLSLDGRRY